MPLAECLALLEGRGPAVKALPPPILPTGLDSPGEPVKDNQRGRQRAAARPAAALAWQPAAALAH
jgi:hypothetical protein